jgi:hypothetical protein
MGLRRIIMMPHEDKRVSDKPWTARENALYRDVKKAVAAEATLNERLRNKDRELNDLRQENTTLAKAFTVRSA